METIEKRAFTAAWQIFEELGMSKHSVVRMQEIIAEKLTEQRNIDFEKAHKYLGDVSWIDDFRKAMEK